MNAETYATVAVADTVVDLSKPTHPDLATARTVALHDVVVMALPDDWCRADVPGPAYAAYACSRPKGHDPLFPHVAAYTHYIHDEEPPTGRIFGLVCGIGPDPVAAVELTDVTAETVARLRAMVAELTGKVETAQREREDARGDLATVRESMREESERADRAEQKISDIRDYVIARKEDQEICAAGTRRFLEHFDLELWDQDYSGSFTVRITATAPNRDAAEEEMLDRLRDALRHTEGVDASSWSDDITTDGIYLSDDD